MSVHEYFEVDYQDYEKIHYEFLRNRNFYLKIKKFLIFKYMMKFVIVKLMKTS